jgi:hypothetical protein
LKSLFFWYLIAYSSFCFLSSKSVMPIWSCNRAGNITAEEQKKHVKYVLIIIIKNTKLIPKVHIHVLLNNLKLTIKLSYACFPFIYWNSSLPISICLHRYRIKYFEIYPKPNHGRTNTKFCSVVVPLIINYIWYPTQSKINTYISSSKHFLIR